jgi:hypothetical protein
MRTPLYNDELEDFLRQQADEHRMYPSDKLWRNIQLTLHGETRWPALTYISIFIIAALVVTTLLMKPEERLKKNVAVYTAANTTGKASEEALAIRSDAAHNSPVEHAYTDKITQHTIDVVNDKVYREQHTSTNALALEPHYPDKGIIALMQTKSVMISPAVATTVVKSPEEIVPQTAAAKNSNEEVATVNTVRKPASIYFSTLGLMNLSGLRKGSSLYSLGNVDNEEIWRSYPLLDVNDVILKKLSKFNFQFYITPSISYRQLTDVKGKSASSYTAIPLNTNYKIDINNIVKHTPSTGAEVGFALGYQLTDRFTVKSGLQFNMRQYNIEAFPAALPPAPAPEIQDGNITMDALAVSAHYTQAKTDPIVLRNRYYEVAAPIGMDYKVFEGTNGIVTINVAATVQPTYTFDKEPFVITTDYKNYADGSSLMRNWNINSSVEAYISYKVGALRWQIGPQFRYQHLPTYGGGYPIREHLLDYGLKLGFTKSLH